jgi:drug/metabolite transporter (DMT)-like permease
MAWTPLRRTERVARDDRGARVPGILLMLGSAVSFSTIGLFTDLTSLPLPDVLVIRGIFGALAIWLVARLFTGQRWTDRANFRWPALSVALLFTIGMTSLVVAYRVGTVVNVSIIYATVPTIVGLIELVSGRRRPPWVFWATSGGVVAGVAIMSGGGLSGGDVAGMGLALLMTVCVAGVILVAREHRDTPMLAASGLACLLSAVVAAPFAGNAVLRPTQLLICAAFGIVTLGLGRVFLVLGSSRVPSRSAALIDVLDAPLTPVWTLVFLGDVPPARGVVGGAVVIAMVLTGVRLSVTE